MGEMEVTIQSILPADEPQGRYYIRIPREATVGLLLKQLCKEAGVPIKPEYSLRSKGHDLLSRDSPLSKYEIEDGTFLHWTSEEVMVNTCTCNTLFFLALLSFIIGTVGIAAICSIKFKPVDVVMDYAIVFDAGSTHTSMFIYKWEDSKYHGTAVANQWGETCKVKGAGISSYERSPSAAGKSLEECLKQAEKSIPTGKHAETPVYLGATAGMRLLNISNPKASQAILDSIRDQLSSSPFNLQNRTTSVRIITGSDEGTFSWVTSNYLTNAFNVEKPWVDGIPQKLMFPTVGALDLGGASTQITFIPEQGTVIPKGFGESVRLFGKDYNVYTHSFLCYGAMQVSNTLFAELIKESNGTDDQIEHPCLPKEYTKTESYQQVFSSPCVSGSAENKTYTFLGTGDVEECRSLLDDKLFNKTGCSYTQCSFNGVFQPTVVGPFFAFSTFFYAADFFNLTKSSSSTNFSTYESAVSSVCNKTWSELQEIPASGATKANLMWYCMEGNYIIQLLHKNYNFTEKSWNSVNFVNSVSGAEVGWTLGFVLYESDSYPVHTPAPRIYPVTFGLLMALFCLFVIVAIGLAIQSRRANLAGNLGNYKTTSYGAI